MLSRERFELYPDCLPVMKEMKERGYSLGMVSNAQKVFTANEIRMLGLEHYFSHMVFSTRYGIVKPDDRLFTITCAMLEVQPRMQSILVITLTATSKEPRKSG
jgi:putative hydrolase of the HAD superfamily